MPFGCIDNRRSAAHEHRGLDRAIVADRDSGHFTPFMVSGRAVGSSPSTSTPRGVAAICKRQALWFQSTAPCSRCSAPEASPDLKRFRRRLVAVAAQVSVAPLESGACSPRPEHLAVASASPRVYHFADAAWGIATTFTTRSQNSRGFRALKCARAATGRSRWVHQILRDESRSRSPCPRRRGAPERGVHVGLIIATFRMCRGPHAQWSWREQY